MSECRCDCCKPVVSAREERRFPNAGKDLLVRASDPPPMGCGVVEMLYLYSDNRSGCVIAYWERHLVGEPLAEVRSVHDRLMTTDVPPETLLAALRWGESLAAALVSQPAPPGEGN